ncbi:phosphoribosyltransferase domain-containing protein [Arthrobacter sp. 35W]|uniref:phosphoribosyltransferase domain-containing protein n=1 Tax=Arthrobacter sp. 35W TaxID=1132441 RepID=UPI00042564CC|nr:phosphoribosyltransferase domain-containing protein [Arthrobacter sp. 35W]
MPADAPVWTGGFVRGALGVAIHTDPDRSLLPVEDLVGLALRRNPKRAHLLVSRVLAKHVPTRPALAMAAGRLLGVLVADAIAGRERPGTRAAAVDLGHLLEADDGSRGRALLAALDGLATDHPGAITIGYAETATGLGALVAESIGSYYLHSTRHAPAGATASAGFEEGHSHATSHRLLPTDPQWLEKAGPVVLVDDELSTGSTIINTIRALHSLVPHGRYIVASLIDLRTDADRVRFEQLAAELGTDIAVVALGCGTIDLAPDILERAQVLIAGMSIAPATASVREPARITTITLDEGTVPAQRSGRFGKEPGGDRAAGQTADTVAAQIAAELAPQLPASGGTLVLGTEEFIHLPLAVAHALDGFAGAEPVHFSTTTRSPIVPLDRADYAIASAATFASHDVTEDGPGIRFAYNVSGSGRRFDTIFVLPEPGTDPTTVDGAGSLTEALAAHCRHVVVVHLPASIPATAERNSPTP